MRPDWVDVPWFSLGGSAVTPLRLAGLLRIVESEGGALGA